MQKTEKDIIHITPQAQTAHKPDPIRMCSHSQGCKIFKIGKSWLSSRQIMVPRRGIQEAGRRSRRLLDAASIWRHAARRSAAGHSHSDDHGPARNGILAPQWHPGAAGDAPRELPMGFIGLWRSVWRNGILVPPAMRRVSCSTSSRGKAKVDLTKTNPP